MYFICDSIRSDAINQSHESLNMITLLPAACAVLKKSYERGWISTRDGNLSLRDPATGSMLITPSAAVKYAITPNQFVPVLESSVSNETGSGIRPSGELELHRQLFKWVPVATTTVLHLHPTYTVAALFAGMDLRSVALAFPEVARYTRVGRDVPALAATSLELAEAVAGSFAQSVVPHIVGLHRHGVVAIGKTPWEAFEHVERLEHVCQMVLASGVRLQSFSDMPAGDMTGLLL
jgi:ribulose-5-phosphate 4-epimerase/fuculose-1-phosphate aldolase